MEYNDESLAFERRRLAEIQLAHKSHQLKFPKGIDRTGIQFSARCYSSNLDITIYGADYLSIPSTECVDYLLDVFSTSQTKNQIKHTETTNYNDEERY